MDGNTALVLQALQREPNTFFSCQEIVSNLFNNWGVRMSYPCAKSCLETLESLHKHIVHSRIERRHATRVPVKVFAFINHKK